MDLRFVEAGNGFNWGKFGVGRFTAAEWSEPTAYPGAESGRLLGGRGWTPHHVWVLDLQTGEGAMFRPGGAARSDLAKHQIWVCPLFADLEARVRGVESRSQRAEEDITAIIETTSETLTRLRRVEARVGRVEAIVESIANHLGVLLPPPAVEEEDGPV